MTYLCFLLALCLIGLSVSCWGYAVVNNVIKLPAKFPSWLFVVIFLGSLLMFAWSFTMIIHAHP
jgi:hypothetical protein